MNDLLKDFIPSSQKDVGQNGILFLNRVFIKLNLKPKWSDYIIFRNGPSEI
ncbi:hypothetical protein LEP1GSC051_1053 [Leptospira sp. P2653]|nr:hypothetical protein LEP1GSC051_1053 [Leptospira sp. P2653]